MVVGHLPSQVGTINRVALRNALIDILTRLPFPIILRGTLCLSGTGPHAIKAEAKSIKALDRYLWLEVARAHSRLKAVCNVKAHAAK